MFIEDKLNLINKGGEKIDKRFKQQLLYKVTAESTKNEMYRPSFNKWFVVPPLSIAALVAAFTLVTQNMFGTVGTSMRSYDSSNVTSVDESVRSVAPSVGKGMLGQSADMIMPYPAPYYPGERVSDSSTRYYNTNASLNLEAHDVNEVVTKVQDVVKSSNGILQSIYVNKDARYSDSAYVSFHVPQDKVFDLVAQIKSLGYEVTGEHISMDDITVNVEDREQNSNQLIESYEQEIERLQTELNGNVTQQRRSQIESQIARYEDLIAEEKVKIEDYKEDITYATLSVSVSEAKTGLSKFFDKYGNNSYFGDLIRSGGLALTVLLMLVQFVGHLVVWFLVFSLLWLPIWFIVRFFRRKNMKK